MQHTIEIPHLDQIDRAAHQFLRAIGQHRIIAFYGPMGAGKTTFIKALCKALGVTDVVNSPTFAIINEYEYPEGLIYHFDFYRIRHTEEAYDFGINDYFESGQYCLMEWPEMIDSILPPETLRVTIRENETGGRTINMDI